MKMFVCLPFSFENAFQIQQKCLHQTQIKSAKFIWNCAVIWNLFTALKQQQQQRVGMHICNFIFLAIQLERIIYSKKKKKFLMVEFIHLTSFQELHTHTYIYVKVFPLHTFFIEYPNEYFSSFSTDLCIYFSTWPY